MNLIAVLLECRTFQSFQPSSNFSWEHHQPHSRQSSPAQVVRVSRQHGALEASVHIRLAQNLWTRQVKLPGYQLTTMIANMAGNETRGGNSGNVSGLNMEFGTHQP